MLWLKLSASHPVKRREAPAAATEVCLVVIAACAARVGVVFPMYGYDLMQSAAILQHQAHLIKSWFRFAQSS